MEKIKCSRALLESLNYSGCSYTEYLERLRSLDPYVFEEVILTAMSNRGYTIQRNSAYSNDGGVDGKVVIDDRLFVIQAKRYRGYIDAADVRAFARLCILSGCHGLFIHTGKTGAKSKQYESVTSQVTIISDDFLVDLCKGDELNYEPFKRSFSILEWLCAQVNLRITTGVR